MFRKPTIRIYLDVDFIAIKPDEKMTDVIKLIKSFTEYEKLKVVEGIYVIQVQAPQDVLYNLLFKFSVWFHIVVV